MASDPAAHRDAAAVLLPVVRSCGRAWLPWRDQVDHRVPLEQGGGNDDVNLQLLCDDCHKIKTAAEARTRYTGV